MPTPTTNLTPAEAVRRMAQARKALREEFDRAVVGQSEVLDHLLIAVFANGNCLLEGSPGTGKAWAVRVLAKLLHLEFSHIHGHPELSTEDVVGGMQPRIDRLTGEQTRRFERGPLFANFVLVEELNRIPHRVQSTLVDPLRDHLVRVGGDRFELPKPFFLMATKNAEERQRTFALTDALSDRFLFSLRVGPFTRDEERRIALLGEDALRHVRQVLRARDVLWGQELATRIVVTPHVVDYAVDLIRSTRPEEPDAPPIVRRCLLRGASPHAIQSLLRGAKARAMLHGRGAAHAADLRALLPSVLRHRVIWRREAVRQGIRIEHLAAELGSVVAENSYDEPAIDPPVLEIVDRGDQLPQSADSSP